MPLYSRKITLPHSMIWARNIEYSSKSNNYVVIFRFLAAAGSRSGENNAQCCFLTPSRRFATLDEPRLSFKFKEVKYMRWVNGASLLITSSDYELWYKGVKLHKKLNIDSHKALIERYELSVSNNKCLFVCSCEKCNFTPIRAPPERFLKFNVKFWNQSGG